MPTTRPGANLATPLSVASLLAALAVAVLWVRSYVVHDALMVGCGDRLVGVHSTAGQFVVADDSDPIAPHPTGVRWRRERDVVPYGPSLRAALVRFDLNQVGTWRVWVFPQWPLVLAAALPPAVGAFRRRRHARVPINACRTCGYDLTGNVSGVCPECGTPLPARILTTETRRTRRNKKSSACSFPDPSPSS